MAKIIRLKADLARKVLEGKKIITIRVGKIKINPGDIIEIHARFPVVKAKVIDIKHKKIKDLTKKELKMDGYESIEELIKDLSKMYKKKIDENTKVTVIIFEPII